MSNPLDGMTQAQWDTLGPVNRLHLMDRSALHPKLSGLEGKRVRVTPKREYGRSTFIVGRTAGWVPYHLAMRAGAHGSADLIRADEVFERVEVLDR